MHPATGNFVSDEMDLFTLLLRLRVRLATEAPASLAWVLPEVLVRCQSEVDDPVGTFEVIDRLARSVPEAGRNALLEALERGVDAVLLEDCVALLAELGVDLAERERDALERLHFSHPGERVHAMYLLCAVGPTTESACRAVLETDLGRLWRLEQLRVEALVRHNALDASITALSHPSPEVRARAEAVLMYLGPIGSDAVSALLHMPPWDEEDERPSPVLYQLEDTALPILQASLNHESPLVRSRARQVLDYLQRDSNR